MRAGAEDHPGISGQFGLHKKGKFEKEGGKKVKRQKEGKERRRKSEKRENWFKHWVTWEPEKERLRERGKLVFYFFSNYVKYL